MCLSYLVVRVKLVFNTGAVVCESPTKETTNVLALLVSTSITNHSSAFSQAILHATNYLCSLGNDVNLAPGFL